MSWEFKDRAIYAETGKATWKKLLILPSSESSLSVTVAVGLLPLGMDPTEVLLAGEQQASNTLQKEIY